MASQYSILIIDDDGGQRRSLALILEHAGCSVTTASTAQEGLRELQELNFDLIILDLVMPGPNRRGLLPLLRKSRPRTPVLGLTGQTCPGQAADLRHKGVRGYLPKPVAPHCLLTQVHTLLMERLMADSVTNARAWAPSGETAKKASPVRRVEETRS